MTICLVWRQCIKFYNAIKAGLDLLEVFSSAFKPSLLKAKTSWLHSCWSQSAQLKMKRLAIRSIVTYISCECPAVAHRKLNSCIRSQHFPLILKEQFFQNASQFKKYCIVDISNAFLSIGLTERAKHFLAIITPFGVYIPVACKCSQIGLGQCLRKSSLLCGGKSYIE